MVKNYNERLIETRNRSLQENQTLYQQRSSEGKPSGVLERVILEQIRNSGAQDERSGLEDLDVDYRGLA